MKRILTALGNPTLNQELKKYSKYEVVSDDLFYQEAVLDFIKEIDKSYPIPSQIAVMSGDEPIDMRQTCDSIEDFEKFKSDTGMELRYAGLITFEKSTGIFKGCIENEKGNHLPSQFVPSTQFVCVDENNHIVGMCNVRHQLNDLLIST